MEKMDEEDRIINELLQRLKEQEHPESYMRGIVSTILIIGFPTLFIKLKQRYFEVYGKEIEF